MRSMPPLVAVRAVALISIPLCGCAPLQMEADPGLSSEARRVWAEVGGRPGADVRAVPCVGSPAAVWIDGGKGLQVTMFVPAGVPAPVATVLMRYELSKVTFVQGDGSLLSNLLSPVRLVDAAMHGPVSELNSLRAVLLPAAPPPRDARRDSIFENPADPSWTAAAARPVAATGAYR